MADDRKERKNRNHAGHCFDCGKYGTADISGSSAGSPEIPESRRRNGAVIFFFAVLLFGLTLWDVLSEDRFFSESENRILASLPEPETKTVLDGSWQADYETYLTDQFAGRDGWIGLKTLCEKQLGRKDINGVYLAKDGYLIEKHDASDYPEEAGRRKAERLRRDVEHYRELTSERGGRVDVMLVPAADVILQDKLPSFAEDYDQGACLRELDDIRIAAESVLSEHNSEEIFYRTDHHWTTLGAYYGYLAWAEAAGREASPLHDFDRTVVSSSFLGTLHSKLNLPVPPDRIELFLPKEESAYRVWYDLEETPRDSLYELSHLQTKNQYGVFLDDNHALVRIESVGGTEREGSILVMKDSFANCFVPFLCEHYETVYVIDKRFYRGKPEDLIREHQIKDVLILYNVIHFLENY